jgi:hypothetical protein
MMRNGAEVENKYDDWFSTFNSCGWGKKNKRSRED